MAGLATASTGRVLVNGGDVTALSPAQRGIAMVFQNCALFPHLSVAHCISCGLPSHNWLGSPGTALGAVTVVAIWQEAGFS